MNKAKLLSLSGLYIQLHEHDETKDKETQNDSH